MKYELERFEWPSGLYSRRQVTEVKFGRARSDFGWVTSKESVENLTLTGLIEGKKNRGRPRIKYLTSLSTWMAERVPEGQRGGMKEQELLRRTKDRKLWKAMIAHVLKGHGI